MLCDHILGIDKVWKMTKSYKELMRRKTFEERFDYLKLNGQVGLSTFGYDRYMNQILYTSKEWRRLRDQIIIRDSGRDLACEDRDIHNGIVIHHINPITAKQIENNDPCVYDPNNLICTSPNTHKAIHFGNSEMLLRNPKSRTAGDTKLW